MESLRELTQMDAEELRDLTVTLLAQLADRDQKIKANLLEIKPSS
jgi:hypothetical protein